ncbi:MAG TPA: FecR domain-containing protein, partial [Gemmatimonadaceae bacterium]|nr:FecR domain-containing protein [Gemmatimonadaceae bacterium]
AHLDVEAALSRVHALMAEPAPAAPRLRALSGSQRRLRRGLMAAGLLAAAVVAGVVVTVRRPGESSRPAVAAAHAYETAVGERRSLVLEDGSKVLLGPASRLEVLPGYGSTTRAVELHGDAFFDVRHDSSAPFSVRVGKALIEDLGTIFTVESDDGVTASVAVVSGSVRIRAADSPASAGVVLGAGDRGAVDDAGTARADARSLRDDDLAWTTGRLAFRNAPLTRVAGELRRWYGVTLRVADTSLANRHVTASFSGEPVDQVLKVIGLTLGAHAERNGNEAVLRVDNGSTVSR